jgi:hypothetical protein
MAIHFLIAVAESVPVIVHERWRHRRIAEPWVAVRIGRSPIRDITTRRINTIMMALFRGLRVGRWRRKRRVIGGRLRMGTTRQSKGK